MDVELPGMRTVRLSSAGDHGLELYQGTALGDLESVACRDDEWGGGDEELTRLFEPGTYWIAVAPWLLGDQEAFEIEIVDRGVMTCRRWYISPEVCAETGPVASPVPEVWLP